MDSANPGPKKMTKKELAAATVGILKKHSQELREMKKRTDADIATLKKQC